MLSVYCIAVELLCLMWELSDWESEIFIDTRLRFLAMAQHCLGLKEHDARLTSKKLMIRSGTEIRLLKQNLDSAVFNSKTKRAKPVFTSSYRKCPAVYPVAFKWDSSTRVRDILYLCLYVTVCRFR